MSKADQQALNRAKTNHGKSAFFAKGGVMAKVNPFAKFEKSGKDVELPGKGKEGSKKEEAFDSMQAKRKFARGGGIELRGKTKGGKC